MAFEKELPQWKEKGVKPPQSKLDEGWKVQDKPPAAWLNWQMNKTYEALKEVQEKAAEKTEVATAIEDTKNYTDQKVAGIDLTKITPDSIGAVKKSDFDAHTADGTKHITVAERNTWNSKETPEGAQAKANAAETNAKNYVNGLQWQRKKVSDDAGNAIVVSDLNADLTTGWYMGSNMANAPTTEWFWVEIIRHNHLWTVQNAYCFNRQSYYQRMKINGNWTPWSQDLFQSGVDAKNRIAGAISAKGVPASASDTFEQLASKIQTIETGRKYASSSFYRSLTYDGTFEVNSLSFKPSEVILLLNLVVVEYSDGSGIAGRTQNMAMVLGSGSAQYEDMGIKLSVGVEFLNNGFVVNHKVHSIGEFYRGAVQVTRWEAIS